MSYSFRALDTEATEGTEYCFRHKYTISVPSVPSVASVSNGYQKV